MKKHAETGGQHQAILPFSAHRLYSLWDMIQFAAGSFVYDLADLEYWREKAGKAVQEHGASSQASEYDKERMLFRVKRLEAVCAELKLESSEGQLSALHNRLIGLVGNQNCAHQIIESSIEAIQNSLSLELSKRQFVFVPPDKAQYFEQETLFGESFHKKASADINREVKEAGNCLAVGLNTAAVFHLMRVAEFGLRALARRFKIKTVRKTIPISEASWGLVMQAIDDINTGKTPTTKSHKRQKEFCNEVLVEMRGFKNFWRDKVMHAHDSYDAPSALSAFNHVKKFMVALAENISIK
jgi:hypothetical protein